MPISARASGKVFAVQTDRMELVGSNRLPPRETGMIVDKGVDFPPKMDAALRAYGEDMWFFRDQSPAGTTRAVNRYQGDHRGCVCATFLYICLLLYSIAATHCLPRLSLRSALLALEKVFSTSLPGCALLPVTFSGPVFPIRRLFISFVRPPALPSSCLRWPKSKVGSPYRYMNPYQ